MSDAHVDPSELHWKKELTGLRKAARFLRDPETCSSLRSPLNSRLVPAASSWNYGNGTRLNSTEVNRSVGYSEHVSGLPVKNEKNGNKVFLYNWRSQSGKSSDYGAKLDGEKYGEVGSVDVSLKDSLEVHRKEDSRSDTYFDDPMTVFKFREPNLDRQVRTVKKLKKGSALSKHSIVRKSMNSNLLDLPSIPLGELTTVQQSNNMEYCNTEDSRDITPRNGYTSRSTSPMPTRGENLSRSSKLVRSIWREDSSYPYTPASTSSYNRYGTRNPSNIGSWDGNTASVDGDDLDHLDLPGSHGCGIPCYWSKRTPKHGGCGGCYSPSLSDTLRRKGSSILCGSRTSHKKRRSSGSNKRRLVTRSSQGMPLLKNNSDGRGGSSTDGQSDDDLSTNFGEQLDMEGLSRLDGRRWSSCRSQEGLELVPLTAGAEEGTSDHIRSLSQKYMPRFFDELIGQNIVVNSLINAISRGRIAPVYLFQGPRGTGKTSTARILTAALNCVATEETKPCGFCRECTDFMNTGKTMDLREVDATNKKGIDRVRYLLKSLSSAPMSCFSRYHVFIINDCHLLPSKTWSSFLKFLEEPLPRVVIILITTDIDNLPHTVLSRCQKYLFNKIKESDIVTRLKKLSSDENLDVDSDALDLIALNAEGSLRDAEAMLDQLSLLGKRITASLVNELVGVVSDEKLLDLLELAMSSDTAETVKRTRELMDSGVDPMALTSQLAGLIMDIIAGTYQLVDSKCNSFFSGRSLTEAELERLKQALKLLSEAERQIRVSNERSTWFTAALLQLGSVPSLHPTHSSSSRKQSSKTAENEPSGSSREVYAQKKKSDAIQRRRNSTSSHDGDSSSQGDPLLIVNASNFAARSTSYQLVEGASAATHEDTIAGNRVCRYISSEKLDQIWEMCIDRCHSKTLKQLLHAHAKLVSISDVEGVLIAFIGFKDGDIKSRAERFVRSITNSIEIVMRHNVEVRMGLMLLRGDASMGRTNIDEFPDLEIGTTEMMERKLKGDSNNLVSGHSVLEPRQEPFKVLNERFYSECKLTGIPKQSDYSSEGVDGSELPVTLVERNSEMYDTEERNEEIPLQRVQAIIDEQRLESAWLQTAEKGTPGSLSRLKPERNQILPQDGVYRPNQMASIISMELSSQTWEDELNHELKSLKINDGRGHHDESGKKVENYPMSPSLLHDRSFAGNFNNENLGYESGQGPGCNGLICWKKTKPYNNKGKIKQGTPIRSRKSNHFLLFGDCMKAKKTDHRFKK